MIVEQRMERFSEAESLDLAATVPVGRIVYSRYALPAVYLVNFRLDGRDPVFHTRKGPMFGAGVAESVVAFEVDRIDETAQEGWFVTFLGRAKLVTSPAEQARLAGLDVHPWAPGQRDHVIKIVTEKIIGRRLPHRPDAESEW
jgi:hypothetical protein